MIKQLIPQGFCLKCQGCCRFSRIDSVWLPCLLEEEIQDLLDKKIPPAAISAKRQLLPIPHPKQEGYICPFLDIDENKCKIYSYRPFECQLYPFLINLRDKKVLLAVDLNCPYIRENLKSTHLEDYTEYLTAFLNTPGQLQLLKDNPQIIQAYEDVQELLEIRTINETK